MSKKNGHDNRALLMLMLTCVLYRFSDNFDTAECTTSRFTYDGSLSTLLRPYNNALINGKSKSCKYDTDTCFCDKVYPIVWKMIHCNITYSLNENYMKSSNPWIATLFALYGLVADTCVLPFARTIFYLQNHIAYCS